jgi:hypothetical protein
MSFQQFGEIIEAPPEGEEVAEFGEIIEEKKPPQMGSQLTRKTGQLGARGIESVLGLPRALGETLESLVPRKTLQAGAEKIGLGDPVKKGLELTQKYAPYKLFPKSEQIRELNDELFGEAFKPQGIWEERVGEAFGEFASMVIPFAGEVKPFRAILTSLGANGAKVIGEELGLDDKKSNYLKLGTYLLGSFIQPNAAKKYYTDQYAKAAKALPENATVDSVKLEGRLAQLKNRLQKGGVSTADKPTLTQIENLEKEMQGAQIPVDSLQAFKRKLNIARGDLYKQLEGNKSGIKTASKNLDDLAKITDRSLETYAKYNPDWGAHYQAANNAFGAAMQSKRVGKFLSNLVGKGTISHLGLAAILGHTGKLGLAVKAAAVGYPTVKAGETIAQIMKSAPLRKEFFRLYTQALAGNAKGAQKSILKLNQDLSKDSESR